MAETALWAATFGQGLGGVVRTAEELERLAKPLGGLTVIGCAFSLVGLSARMVSLMAAEREGRGKLVAARADLREASLALVEWLFGILGAGFEDGDGLAARVFDVLGECWEAAGRLEGYLLENWARRAWTADEVREIVRDVGVVKGKLLAAGLLKVVVEHAGRISGHERRIVGLEEDRAAGCVDEFRPYAPEASQLEVGLVAAACVKTLSQLKEVVFSRRESSGSGGGSTGGGDASDLPLGGSPSIRPVALACIVGEGGVGKTSGCKLLCADVCVRSQFAAGAILWLDVGQGAKEDEVKGELADALFQCGGERSAGLVRSSGSVKASVDIARQFFSKRRILVVLDNVWEAPASTRVGSWAVALSKIACCPGSAVIVTTRFESLSNSNGFHRVHLGRLMLSDDGEDGWPAAEKLYDSLLKATPEELTRDGYKKSRRKALELSCGLPLAITTFAGLVRSRLQISNSVESVLSKIEQRVLGLVGKSVGADMNGLIGHPGLFAAIEASLAHLDEHKGPRLVPSPLPLRRYVNGNDVRLFRASYDGFSNKGKSLSSRYAALQVMSPSSTRLSLPVLCHLWHVPTVSDAEEIALLFVNVGLGRFETDSLSEGIVFSLHDLQYEFCVGVSGTSADSALDDDSRLGVCGHALFLSSCESILGSSGGADEDAGIDWVNFCFEENCAQSKLLLHGDDLRRHLAQNLFRHLFAATSGVAPACFQSDGLRRMVLGVLTNFSWLRGRTAKDGRASAVSDCTYALDSREPGFGLLLTGETETTIRLLRQTLMRVGEGVSTDFDGTLGGSLVQMAQVSSDGRGVGLDACLVEKLSRSVGNEVFGPWLKPVFGCARVSANDRKVSVEATVGSGERVLSIAALGDGVHVVSGSVDGVVRVHESVDLLETVLPLRGHTSGVSCVDAARRGGPNDTCLIVSGGYDGAVRCWEVDLELRGGIDCVDSRKCGAIVGECGSPVWTLAVSRDGTRIVSGCANGLVFLWKRLDAVVRFQSPTSFNCATDGRIPRGVLGVAVSGSGLVVAGAENGDVALWSSEGDGAKERIERFIPSAGRGAELRSICISRDDSYFVILFSEPAGYEVWDLCSRERYPLRVMLPSLTVATCMSLSGDQGLSDSASGPFVVGGWDEEHCNSISEHTIGDAPQFRSERSLVSVPRSVVSAFIAGKRMFIVGADDGCVRALDADRSRENTPPALLINAAPRLSLQEVSAVAVMPVAGWVVAGHEDGIVSLWQGGSGQYSRRVFDVRGDWVGCIDISEDESMAVSGHRNGTALVWDTATWECLFALKGHPLAVVCVTIVRSISLCKLLIVTVDWDGKVQLWDGAKGMALWLRGVETGLKWSDFGSRGGISLRDGRCLWAVRGISRWKCKEIDLAGADVILESDECPFDMSMCTGGEGRWEHGEARWIFGATFSNKLVEIASESGCQGEFWAISSGTEDGFLVPRVDCCLQSTGGVVSGRASLNFDNRVYSIAAGLTPPDEDGRRHIVVACPLRHRSNPAIFHLMPAR